MSCIPQTRRGFLRTGSIAVVAGAMALARDGSDQAALERRRAMGLKLACSSVAFPDLKWDGALEQIQKLCFRYAELAMLEGWAHVNPSALSDPEGQGKRIAALTTRLDVEPIAIRANFVLGDANLFPGLTTPDAAARKTILAQFERVVSAARVAEIPLIIVSPGRLIDSIPPDLCRKNACDLLIQMHGMVAKRGLMLAFENQTGSIGQEPGDAHEILERVPGLRLDYQLCHVVANQYSPEQTEPLMKYVAHIGVRNAKPGADDISLQVGQLSYPIHPFFELFQRHRVHAYVSIGYSRAAEAMDLLSLKAIVEREGVAA